MLIVDITSSSPSCPVVTATSEASFSYAPAVSGVMR
jgi:hypothetical protein